MVILSLITCFPTLTRHSNWKSSRQDLSVLLDRQHNKFCCFFSTAVQPITPVTTPIASAWQYSSVPVQVGTHCQLPTCRYNNTCIHTYTHTYNIHKYMHTYTHIHRQAYPHTYIHTNTYIHMHSQTYTVHQFKAAFRKLPDCPLPTTGSATVSTPGVN